MERSIRHWYLVGVIGFVIAGCQFALSFHSDATSSGSGLDAGGDASSSPADAARDRDDSGDDARAGGIRVRSKETVPKVSAADKITFQRPADTQRGDLLWAVVDFEPVPAMTPQPVVFDSSQLFEERGTLQALGPDPCNLGGGIHAMTLFTRVAQESEPQSYTISFNAVHDVVSGALVSVVGVDPKNPIDDEIAQLQMGGVDGGGGARMYQPASVTTSVPGAFVLYFLGDIGGGVWTMKDPTTGQLVGDVVVNNGHLAVFAEKTAAVGSTPPRQFAVVSDCASNGFAKVVALRPE